LKPERNEDWTWASSIWQVVEQAELLAAVEPPEGVGEHERHYEDTRAEGERVLGFAQIKGTYATDEQVGYREIEEAPKNVDR
jgi:hypothetical protein